MAWAPAQAGNGVSYWLPPKGEPTENEIQSAFFQWARLHHEAKRAYAIPNGGKRSKSEAGRLKAEGVRAGVLDVHLPLARGGAHGLYIEFKSSKGRLSTEQSEEIDRLVADGFAVAVCRSSVSAVELTQAYLGGKLGPVLTA